MTRLTPEREAEIRAEIRRFGVLSSQMEGELLDELDAVRAELAKVRTERDRMGEERDELYSILETERRRWDDL